MNDFTLFLILLVLAALCRPLTTLCHELGHAVPILLLTPSRRVDLFVGSHGDRERSRRLSFGRLQLFLRYDPWLHIGGLTRYDRPPLNRAAQFLIVLGGPLVSLLIASFALWASLHFGFHAILLGLSILFFAAAIFDFAVNIIPQSQPIVLADGSSVENDGRQLWRLLRG